MLDELIPLHLLMQLADAAAASLLHGPCQQGSAYAFWEVSPCEVPTIPLGLRVLWRRQCHPQHGVHGHSSDQDLREVSPTSSPPWEFLHCSGQILQLGISKDISHGLAVKHGVKGLQGPPTVRQCWTSG